MISELSHILDTHEVTLVIKKDDKVTRVVVLPKLLESARDKDVSDDEIAALQQPLVCSGTPEELDEELADKLLKFVSLLKDGKDNFDVIQKQMDEAVAAKKKKAAPKTKKPAAKKRKTKEQLKEEARVKHAETKQTDMFGDDDGRLKSAAEKAEEKVADLSDESLLEGI